ncbi:helix-turn-helix domain-containing protein [Bradyrhizobium sp. 25ACV]
MRQAAIDEDLAAGHEAAVRGRQERGHRYRRAIRDVSDKVLIQQLKEREADGLVKRTDYKEVPPRVDYSLTPLGHSLAQALVPLCTWGTEHMAEVSQVFAERATWTRRGGQPTV